MWKEQNYKILLLKTNMKDKVHWFSQFFIFYFSILKLQTTKLNHRFHWICNHPFWTIILKPPCVFIQQCIIAAIIYTHIRWAHMPRRSMCDTDHRALLLNAHRFQFFRTFTWSYSAWNHNSHRLIQFLSRTKKRHNEKKKTVDYLSFRSHTKHITNHSHADTLPCFKHTVQR